LFAVRQATNQSEMNGRDFSKLNGLITKLTAAANKAATTSDERYKKNKKSSLNALNDMPHHHLNQFKQGLRTTN